MHESKCADNAHTMIASIPVEQHSAFPKTVDEPILEEDFLLRTQEDSTSTSEIPISCYDGATSSKFC